MYGNKIMAQLSAYLEREFQQRGWSQRQAAAAMAIPVQTINDLIRNPNKTPDLPTLRKLADGLRVSIVRLIELAGFGENETPDPAVALTDEERAFIQSLTVEELRDLLDFVRRQRQRD